MPDAGHQPVTGTIRVLFVDDEPALLRALERVLRRTATLAIRSCTSAEEALELLQHETFDVIVSDLKMPSMDGLRFLQLAADAAPGVKQIMLTGSFGHTELLKEKTTVRCVLEKPCSTADLVSAIEGVAGARDVMYSPSEEQPLKLQR